MSNKFRFYLIDDNTLETFVHEKMLAIGGLSDTTHVFNAAEDALKYMKETQHQILDTVILLDLQMPGMNGFEFLDQFAGFPQAVKDKIRIYMLSSTIDSGDMERARKNPYIIELISKPLDIEKLRKLLAK